MLGSVILRSLLERAVGAGILWGMEMEISRRRLFFLLSFGVGFLFYKVWMYSFLLERIINADKQYIQAKGKDSYICTGLPI